MSKQSRNSTSSGMIFKSFQKFFRQLCMTYTWRWVSSDHPKPDQIMTKTIDKDKDQDKPTQYNLKQWYPCSCGHDWSWIPRVLVEAEKWRSSTAVDSELRPLKSGVEIELEYHNTDRDGGAGDIQVLSCLQTTRWWSSWGNMRKPWQICPI